ncbi:hypothetical protein [Acetobacterium bakii]|nr:hypothetical protein [Acetobacterium bakii]
MKQELLMKDNEGYNPAILNVNEQVVAEPVLDGNLGGDYMKAERLGQ